MQLGKISVSLVILLLVGTGFTQAAPVDVRDLAAGDGLTAAINGGQTYFYGFDVVPTDPSVDLDGVAAGGVGDFHTLHQPNFDTTAGLATSTDGSSEALLRTDFTNSIWRAQFLDAANWTVEARVNLLGTGTEGEEGVLGLFEGNAASKFDLRIGSSFVRDDIAGENFATDMDNTGWHTWRIAHQADVGCWIYRDGVLINTEARLADGSWNRSFAGDYSTTLAGDWQMDYYAIDPTGAYAPVPEPATLMLLAMGGVLSLVRRK